MSAPESTRNAMPRRFEISARALFPEVGFAPSASEACLIELLELGGVHGRTLAWSRALEQTMARHAYRAAIALKARRA